MCASLTTADAKFDITGASAWRSGWWTSRRAEWRRALFPSALLEYKTWAETKGAVLARKKTRRPKRPYRVFISHSGDDIWVARQLSAAVEHVGATTFLDVRDIAHGDNFNSRILEEMPTCEELLALFTPWSRQRPWVRHEIGMAAVLRLRIVCVFYHVTIADFTQAEGGLGPIDGLNMVDINAIDTYLEALSKRARQR